jgi:hypothetical protein
MYIVERTRKFAIKFGNFYFLEFLTDRKDECAGQNPSLGNSALQRSGKSHFIGSRIFRKYQLRHATQSPGPAEWLNVLCYRLKRVGEYT